MILDIRSSVSVYYM